MSSPVRDMSPTVRIHSEPSSTIVTYSEASGSGRVLRFGKKTAMMLSVIVITGKVSGSLYLSWNWAARKERQKLNNTLAQSDIRHQVKRAKETDWSQRRYYRRCRRKWPGARNLPNWSRGLNRIRMSTFVGRRLEVTEPTSQKVSLLGSKWEICFKLSSISMTIYNSNLVSILR